MNDSLFARIKPQDGTLESLASMAESGKFKLPPIPESYLEGLHEISAFSSYATSSSLVPLTGQNALFDFLSRGHWPDTGMALQLFPIGRWIYWQYLIVGRVNLIQVNLRILQTGDQSDHALSLISFANAHLSRFFAAEVNLARHLAVGPREPQETARLILFGNPDGARPRETHYTWSETEGLDAGRQETAVFGVAGTNSPATEDLVILRP